MFFNFFISNLALRLSRFEKFSQYGRLFTPLTYLNNPERMNDLTQLTLPTLNPNIHRTRRRDIVTECQGLSRHESSTGVGPRRAAGKMMQEWVGFQKAELSLFTDKVCIVSWIINICESQGRLPGVFGCVILPEQHPNFIKYAINCSLGGKNR